ncbi:MAG: inorganic diphosphatase [Candidatus Heimdallarchaeota archaeon]
MKNELPPGPMPPRRIFVRVEIPSGSKVKYEYNETYNAVFVDRILHSSVVYPTAYGFIPKTLCEDGDPLDVLIHSSVGSMLIPGSIIAAKPVAVLKMEDEKGEDDKIVAIPTEDPRMEEIESISSIPKHLLNEIEEFFDTYKHLERGKTTKIVGWGDENEAERLVLEAIARYNLITK